MISALDLPVHRVLADLANEPQIQNVVTLEEAARPQYEIRLMLTAILSTRKYGVRKPIERINARERTCGAYR